MVKIPQILDDVNLIILLKDFLVQAHEIIKKSQVSAPALDLW